MAPIMSHASPSGSSPHRVVFGDRIRALRVAQGISQERLAEASGLHRTYVSSLERGQRNVGLDNIHALADALGVEPARLFDEDP